MMSRQQLWELQYRQKRYMQTLDRPELDARFHDVLNNFSNIVGDGKIGLTGFDQPENPRLYWLETWTHVLHEYSLRGIGLPPFDRSKASLFGEPGYKYELATCAIERVHAKRPYLAKFISHMFAREMFERGRILIRLASEFHNLELDVARRDNERDHSGSRIDFRDGRSNYLMYCMSMGLRPRLFADFKADAAVIIRSPGQFVERLIQASDALPFETDGETGAVTYVDPLRDNPNRIRVGFSKRFSFAYQEEWRFIWRPRGNAVLGKEYFLELGSLEDIAELVMLEGTASPGE